MTQVTCIEKYIDSEKNYYSCFLIEPLEAGHGITLGNALRRTLLSDLTTFSITGVRINDLKHEFSTVEGLREDPLEIILNLKEIIFKSSIFLEKEKINFSKLKGFLHIKGPIIVTAGMFQLPQNMLTIINPNQYICTLLTPSEFYLEIDIENGKGYRLTEETRQHTLEPKLSRSKAATLLVDAIFTPIKKVNYKIKLIHDTQGNIKESLNFEITTNGSITPERSLHEAAKIIMNLFYPLFIQPQFLKTASYLRTKKRLEEPLA
jgi:DNA-directed RNA polymerase subunit alpha